MFEYCNFNARDIILPKGKKKCKTMGKRLANPTSK